MSYAEHQYPQASPPPLQGDYGSYRVPPQGPPPTQDPALPSTSNQPAETSPALDTNGSFQGGQYRIDHRDSNTVLRCHLQPGAEIKGKPGAMVAMDSSVQIKGKLKFRYLQSIPLFISLHALFIFHLFFFNFFSLKKLVTGSEMSESLFTGPGEVLLAPEAWGDIFPIVLDGQTKWKVGHHAFLASTMGVTRTIKGQGISKALFSGEGLVVYHVAGEGVFFVQSLGAIIRRTLQPGEQWIVDNGNLVAWSANYAVERIGAGGLISGLHTGAGFVCRFTGPGTVYVQTRSPSRLGSWIHDQALG
ncbi:hypothetical protein BS47DRAFT_332417 [Hydnum rufescens UP504]|uniref:Altered inheritance of mitochondria protein 24, mitochondrial n=1 Tax=Hydnum rufescens UP504 TaxID=1448309 RepID=A0A9P6B5U4_9AGAM|nr:hypothetical protein BS47DRAFT_332417 [Hydnum rufescens UP504]